MNKYILLLVAASILGACVPAEKNEVTVVSVSIEPLKYIVDQLTGEDLDVNVMVPPGASHATYAPTTAQLQKLSDSNLYIQIGHLGYEEAFMSRLAGLNPNMHLLNLSSKVELIRGPEIDHGDHVHKGGVDPHIWMSPAVMLELLPLIREAILEVFPETATTMEVNYPVLYEEVSKLHNTWEETTQSLRQHSFMIFHPALTYLARDYGFEQVPLERDGKEPSPALLRQIIDQARKHHIGLILIQEEFDTRNAHLISEETGAVLVQINPMAYNWIDEMEEILNTFKVYLK